MPDVATMRGLAEEQYGRIDWVATLIIWCPHKRVGRYILGEQIYFDLEDVGAGYWMYYQGPARPRLFVKAPEVRRITGCMSVINVVVH